MTNQLLLKTRNDLYLDLYSLLSKCISGIGYLDEEIELAGIQYALTVYPDGSLESIVRGALTIGGLQEYPEAPGQTHRPIPTTGGDCILHYPYNDEPTECSLSDDELVAFYHQVREHRGLPAVSVSVPEPPSPHLIQRFLQTVQKLAHQALATESASSLDDEFPSHFSKGDFHFRADVRSGESAVYPLGSHREIAATNAAGQATQWALSDSQLEQIEHLCA